MAVTVERPPGDTTIRPFTVEIPEADLEDLRARIAVTRWPERETVEDDSQGVPLPGPAVWKLALGESLDHTSGDLPRGRSFLPGADGREFPGQRAFGPAGQAIFQVVNRVQADGPHGPGQETRSDRGERCDLTRRVRHPFPNR